MVQGGLGWTSLRLVTSYELPKNIPGRCDLCDEVMLEIWEKPSESSNAARQRLLISLEVTVLD